MSMSVSAPVSVSVCFPVYVSMFMSVSVCRYTFLFLSSTLFSLDSDCVQEAFTD